MKTGRILSNLCLFFALAVFCFFILPTTAEATESVANGTCGDGLIWVLDNNGVLTISGAGVMDNFEGTESMPWWEHHSLITSVVIREGVTAIGDYAFSFIAANTGNVDAEADVNNTGVGVQGGVVSSRNNRITVVSIPNSVTDIGEFAFHNCANLKDVYYAGSQDQWAAVIMDQGNGKLQNATVHDGLAGGACGDDLFWTLDKEGTLTVFGTGSMYHFATPDLVKNDPVVTAPWSGQKINAVIIEDGVASVGKYAFYNCGQLKHITIPESVTNIDVGAFSGCDVLEEVFYGGTETDRENIVLSGGNGVFENAFWIYNADEKQASWVSRGDKWYYYQNKVKVTGWKNIGGIYYFFDNSGVMQTGWLKSGNIWYYLKSSGAMATGWMQVSGVWYYFAGSGAMQTGWLQLGSTWYYLDTSGAMITGWKNIGGIYYFFDNSGVMQTGWLKSGNTWYYLKSSGAMATGWAQVSGVWYYFAGSGTMQTGWQKINDVWYYFQTSGAMQTGWLKLGNIWYYFHSSGAMATDPVKIGAKTYYFNTSGACLNP